MWLQNRNEYWKEAKQKVMKVYAQKATAIVVIAHARFGWSSSYASMTYFCVPVMIVAIDRKNGPRKSPSRSCLMDSLKDPAYLVKRRTIVIVTAVNSMRLRM